MRTTIRLDDALLRRAKARAAASGRSLNDFISDAVRAALAPARGEARVVELPTFPGGRLLPGVDLDDSAALLDLMESPVTYGSGTEGSVLRRVSEGGDSA
jgi:plasmid stability protein